MASLYNGTNYFYDMEPPVIALVDAHLWKMFNSVGTEMIITKIGRKLFPTIKIRLYNLDPNATYDVALHMRISKNCRLKFQAKSGWVEAGTCDPTRSKDVYVHFDSGKTGHELMMKPLSFDKIRVTNSLPAALCTSGSMYKYNDFICLNSMHEYLPTVILTVKTPHGKRSLYYPLELTKFIAVTAYQNKHVTEIKINKNPFAKGFRADGQAKKRKNKQENVEDPKPKKSPDNPDRLSPYQDSFISAWGISPSNPIMPYPFVIAPKSVFSYPHLPEGFDAYSPQTLPINAVISQTARNPDEGVPHLIPSTPSPLTLKKQSSQPKENNATKLGFSVHRILYEL